MARLFQLVIVTAFATLLPVASHACEFLAADKGGSGIPATFDTVADGVVSGFLRCGREAYPAYVWTLAVDADQPSLGIRDDKLLDTDSTGPLGELLAADIEDHVRMTVLERTDTIGLPRSPVPEGWFKLTRFFTFCESAEGADPLDCSVGAARIKGWRKAEDTDRDGYLDMSTHEISYYDGASKLHFMSFVTPWSESLTADAGVWIEAVNAVSDVLQPRKVAYAAP